MMCLYVWRDPSIMLHKVKFSLDASTKYIRGQFFLYSKPFVSYQIYSWLKNPVRRSSKNIQEKCSTKQSNNCSSFEKMCDVL